MLNIKALLIAAPVAWVCWPHQRRTPSGGTAAVVVGTTAEAGATAEAGVIPRRIPRRRRPAGSRRGGGRRRDHSVAAVLLRSATPGRVCAASGLLPGAGVSAAVLSGVFAIAIHPT